MKQFKFFVFLLFFSSELFCQYIVAHQYPQLPCKTISTIQFVTPTCGYAVGRFGMLIKTTNGGDKWDTLSIDTPFSLYALCFIDSLTGYVAGNKFFFRTTDGGLSWTHSFIEGTASIQAISFPDRYNGWLLDFNGIFRTTDGGSSWILLTSFKNYYKFKIKFFNTRLGYYLSDFGLFRTEDGGLSWRQIVAKSVNNAVTIVDSTHLYYNNVSKFYSSSDGGLSWNVKSLNTEISLNQLEFGDLQFGIGVVSGTVNVTRDSGKTWVKSKLTDLGLYAISLPASNNWWVAGDYGVLYRSTDMGYSWGTKTQTTLAINSISRSDSSTLHAVGNGGLYIRTTDLGKSWIKMPLLGKSTYNFFKACFPSPQVGFTVGTNGTILKTTNGGRSWNWLNSGTLSLLYDVFFLDTSLGFAVGDNGRVLKTTDGGNSWVSKSNSGQFVHYSVHFANRDTGYICGISGSMRTVNGGESWDIRQGSYIIPQSSSFYSEKGGYAIGLYGKIYKTRTTGAAWEFIAEPDPNATFISFIDSLNGVVAVNGNSYYGKGDAYRTSDGGRSWLRIQNLSDGGTLTVTMLNKNEFLLAGTGAMIIKFTNPSIPLFTDDVSNQPQEIFSASYPNPFSTFTTIKYSLSSPCFVMLKVYDALGREVCTLVEQEQQPGKHTSIFQGKDKAAGIYFYKLIAGKRLLPERC